MNRLFSRDFGPLGRWDVTTENRGVPGSSPGLAISKPRDPAWLRDALVGGALTGRTRLLLSGKRGVFGSSLGPDPVSPLGFSDSN